MKTKTFFALALTFNFLTFTSRAQAPNWQWAQRAGGTSSDYGQGCSTDAGGNIFVTGSFESPTITFGTTVLTNAGSADMFIVKYDTGGNVLWAKSTGGASGEQGRGCSTDAGGNIFVTGYFGSPTITFGTTVLTNADNTGITEDMFIVKYDAGGNVLWAKSAGGASVDNARGCSTDAGGNIFVTGTFKSSTITFGTTVLTSAGFDDMFIVKYDPSGNVLWAKSAGGVLHDNGSGCFTDAGGSIFVTGSFNSPTLYFGTTVLTNADNTGTTYDMFIVKYDAGGNVLWAKSAGGALSEQGRGCSTDAGGNIFVTGSFDSPTITFGTTVLTNAGWEDMFIVKYDAGGNALWAKSAGGTSSDYGQGCSTGAGGNVFVTGAFQSPTLTFGTTVLTGAGGADMFIVKLAGTTTVGINELSDEESFSVFPNPTSGKFKIQVSGSKHQVSGIEIYNVLGEKVYQSATYNQKFEIDLSKQPNGIYFINISALSDPSSGGKTEIEAYTQKLIIQK